MERAIGPRLRGGDEREQKMDTSMDFELTMRMLFGDKAYQIASQEAHPTHRRKWIGKAVKQLLRDADKFDTTVRHKKMLLADLEAISNMLKGVKEPSWSIIYRLLRVCVRLFGYDFPHGARCHTPAYWQNSSQHYTAEIFQGGDAMLDYYDEQDTISVRQTVVMDLKKQGLSDFKIALVLNTTEYAVKQLRR